MAEEVPIGNVGRCARCGGEIVLRAAGPGQAVWACADCGDIADIALHAPPKPYVWSCTICGRGSYSRRPPADRPVCLECEEVSRA